MTTLIIEDDYDSQQVLSLLLRDYFPEIRVLKQCYSAQEGIEAIGRYQPELVFLDIGLPDQSGFDLLGSLPQVNFEIIFVSAHNHFAAQAFRWSALDYLVKPVSRSLLEEAIEKTRMRRNMPGSVRQLQQLILNINNLRHSKPLERLALPTQTDIEFVDINDIIRIEGEKNYSTFCLSDKRRITVSRTLGDYEKMLSGGTNFMRIQKSHLVNLSYVRKYVKTDGGWVITADGAELPVSPLKRDELLQRLSIEA